jgi:dihydrofolate reductase
VAVTPSFGIGNAGTVPWACVGKTLKHDLQYFRQKTMECFDPSRRNAVVMGRLTWESIPVKNRPLRNRINFIVSSSLTSEAIKKDLPDTEDYLVIDSNVCNNERSAIRNLPQQTQQSTICYSVDDLRQFPSRLIVVVPSFDDIFKFIHEHPVLEEIIEKVVVIGGSRLFEESLFHPWFDTLHLTQILEQDFVCDTFLTDKTVEYLKQQDLNNFVIEDNIIEDGIKYR